MGAIASQITSLTTVYSKVYSDADQRKHQSSASLVFVRWIHRWPVYSPHKWPVRREMFPFDDAIMELMGSAQVIILSGSGFWVRSTKHLCQSSRSHGNYVHLTTCNEIRLLKWSGHHCRIHFMYIRKIANTYKMKRLISDLYSLRLWILVWGLLNFRSF